MILLEKYSNYPFLGSGRHFQIGIWSKKLLASDLIARLQSELNKTQFHEPTNGDFFYDLIDHLKRVLKEHNDKLLNALSKEHRHIVEQNWSLKFSSSNDVHVTSSSRSLNLEMEVMKEQKAAIQMVIELLDQWRLEKKVMAPFTLSKDKQNAYRIAGTYALSLFQVRVDSEEVSRLFLENIGAIDQHLGRHHSNKLRGMRLILSGTLCLIAVGLMITALHWGTLAALPLLNPIASYAATAIGTGVGFYLPATGTGLTSIGAIGYGGSLFRGRKISTDLVDVAKRLKKATQENQVALTF